MTTSVLTIDSLLFENAGNLECAMDLGSKTVRSKPCALVVVGIEQPPTSSDFLIGETGKLFCIATGWWFKAGVSGSNFNVSNCVLGTPDSNRFFFDDAVECY